jgi:hypothetical protein
MKKILLAFVLMVVLSACASTGAQPPATITASQTVQLTAVPTATPVPVPSNIPIMPNATDLRVTESDIAFFVKSDLNKVIEFYSKEMPARGWREQEKPSALGNFGRMYFATENQQVSFFLTYSEPLNQVQVRMTIINLNVANPTPVK